MTNVPQDADTGQAPFSLSPQQRHDLKSALLSVRWAAELLQPSDGSEPPCELIAGQLMHAYSQLEPVIEYVLNVKGELRQ
ncbi:MAG: hypothetical protein EBR09_10285 [Proteobacteria bacterium]|jgi:hypothetical protein|nr:hypothetical protein [Pseudomonadota bacterium]